MRSNSAHIRRLVLASLLAAGGLVPVLSQPASAASTFTVNSTADTSDGSCNSTPDCTLREAIAAANLTTATDTIQFALGSGTPVIAVGSGGLGPLPAVTQPVSIRGATGGATRVELDGTAAGAGAHGLDLQGGNSTVSKLVIGGFSERGILLEDAGADVVRGCYIGVDAAGTSAFPNHIGIWVEGIGNNTIGGTAVADRNVISGNTSLGVLIFNGASTTTLQGNYVGIDASGTAAVPNSVGVEIQAATDNVIGGTVAGARNVISGNTNPGVYILDSFTATSTQNNLVQGNYIGTDKTGAVALGNGGDGVREEFAANTTTIGGTTPAARNVISANGGDGVNIQVQPPFSGSTDVEGNYIGTDATGTKDLGNGSSGVHIGGSKHNDIGGTAPGAGNVISGNHDAGVLIDNPFGSTPDTTFNRVRGNLIGTNAAGTGKLGNGYGVQILGQRANTIGGTTAAARNVISGNAVGMALDDNAIANTIVGNAVGTDVSGKALPNEADGISIVDGSFNTIGGTAPGAGNVIANNGPSIVGGSGVFIDAGRGNTISGNSIYANSRLGIDLGDDGVTANDPDDADAGPNDLQNFPTVQSAVSNGSAIRMKGLLSSQPRTSFVLELFSSPTCDGSGNGEGRRFLGTTSTSTDHLGNGDFDVTLSISVAPGQRITATATDPNGSTSEFSACKTVVSGTP